jgi:2'-5' RNA ligase
MKVLKFKEWLIESLSVVNEDNGNHKYGCAMVYFNFPEINEIHKQISDEDIYTENDSERGFGLETESHITLLYGLHEGIDEDEVIKICKSENISELILHNVSTFENEKYDVLKFDVRYPTKSGAFLHKINSKLQELPHTNGFPDYHPHSTIAYLKCGSGKKYVEKFKDLEINVNPLKIVYSKPDNTQIEETLK